MRTHAHAPNYAIASSLSSFVVIVVAFAAMSLFASTSQAQERARDFIEPRVSKTQFQQFCQKVGLQPDQRQIANISYSDYETTLADLATRLDAQALAAGRDKVDDSLSGKSRIESDELKRLRCEVLRIYLQAGPETDAALESLVTGIEVLLNDDQTLKFDAARKWLHREILLHPRAAAATYQEYAGDGVDVLLLVEDARGEGGELAGLPPDALNAILNAYEEQLDQVLIDTDSANRQGSVVRKIATIEKDADTLKREETAAVARWKRLYDLNTQTVVKIADAAQSALDARAAAAFKQRFDRESFKWLYPRLKPDRQIEWIRAQSTIAPDAMAKAEQYYAEYVLKRDALSRAAIDMMLKARNEYQTFLYAMMDNTTVDERIKGNLWSDLMKNTGEQSHLQSTVSSQLEGVLDDATRQALRDAMKKPDRAARPAPASSGR